MEIYDIIGKLLAAFVVSLVAYLVPKARAWFVANTDKTAQERINQLVTAFARAAEQLFHDTDPPGPSASSLSGNSCLPWALRSPRPLLT